MTPFENQNHNSVRISVAARAIDRPYHFRSGPTTLGPRKAKQDAKLSLEYPTVLPLSRLSGN